MCYYTIFLRDTHSCIDSHIPHGYLGCTCGVCGVITNIEAVMGLSTLGGGTVIFERVVHGESSRYYVIYVVFCDSKTLKMSFQLDTGPNICHFPFQFIPP